MVLHFAAEAMTLEHLRDNVLHDRAVAGDDPQGRLVPQHKIFDHPLCLVMPDSVQVEFVHADRCWWVRTAAFLVDEGSGDCR